MGFGAFWEILLPLNLCINTSGWSGVRLRFVLLYSLFILPVFDLIILMQFSDSWVLLMRKSRLPLAQIYMRIYVLMEEVLATPKLQWR